MIPGLQRRSFARLGGIHRNTFINSPTLLDDQMRLKSHPNIRFAGQITGVEGYVESAAMGLLAGRMAAAEILGRDPAPPPPETAMGALVTHITGGADAKTFQPMNVNFGLFPPIDAKGAAGRGRKDRYKAYTDRAMPIPRSSPMSPPQMATGVGDVVLARREMGTSYHLAVVVDDAARASPMSSGARTSSISRRSR
jgi:tRNA:m(5)U-54 methyltransferase